MQSEFKGTPVFCRNCSHSIDYHNPEMENLVCSFQKCLCKNYLDHDDFYYYLRNRKDSSLAQDYTKR